MEIRGNDVLILGGSGLVGMAVARELLPHGPASIVLSALRRDEAEAAVAELQRDGAAQGVRIEAEWGDLFMPEAVRERSRADILGDVASRGMVLDDLFGELSDDVVERSTLGAMLLRRD